MGPRGGPDRKGQPLLPDGEPLRAPFAQPLLDGAHGGRHGRRLPPHGSCGWCGTRLQRDGVGRGHPLRRGEDLGSRLSPGRRERAGGPAVRLEARAVPRGCRESPGAPGQAPGAHRRQHGLSRAQGHPQGRGVGIVGRPRPRRQHREGLQGRGHSSRDLQDTSRPQGGGGGRPRVRARHGAGWGICHRRARKDREPALSGRGRLGHRLSCGPGRGRSRDRVG